MAAGGRKHRVGSRTDREAALAGEQRVIRSPVVAGVRTGLCHRAGGGRAEEWQEQAGSDLWLHKFNEGGGDGGGVVEVGARSLDNREPESLGERCDDG